MKQLLFAFIALCLFSFAAIAQHEPEDVVKSGFRASLRGGYDVLPKYKTNIPYLDHKGGLSAGASVNYYWNWIGIGADFDYIQNKPQSTYPTDSLFLGRTRVSGFNLTEEKITRMFYGIGPSFKYQKNNRFDAELMLRGGLASIKGGKINHSSTTPLIALYNFSGYDAKSVPSAKGQLQFNYFITPSIGLHAGGYYMHHFGVSNTTGTGNADYFEVSPGDNGMHFVSGKEPVTYNAPKADISSIGLFAGLTLRLFKKKQENRCPVCGQDHYPHCCVDCGCVITVTARDKFTNEVLPNADVVLTDETGMVVQSGTTNSFGVAVFKDVPAGTYSVKGQLYNVPLTNAVITKNEFTNCTKSNGIQKELIYTDENFIIRGQVVACNSATPLSGASVVLINTLLAEQKNTMTNTGGEFIFPALQNATYDVYGKMNNYFSQTETVTTNRFDRNKTLFIKLQVCMEKVDCGSAIRLNNIHYDLNKYNIREDAKPELDKLVQFLRDNEDVSVELSSHTDSRAGDSYNMTLSQNRANAAVDYIVSQGIARNRIIGIGYGETRLLNRCKDGVSCSEAEHQLNRRTEMKIICPDKQ